MRPQPFGRLYVSIVLLAALSAVVRDEAFARTLKPSLSSAHYHIIYSFGGRRNDGVEPYAGLTAGTNGVFYGTTCCGGGGSNAGTVFQLTPQGSGYAEHILHAFNGAEVPLAPVTEDLSGNLYGTTSTTVMSSSGGNAWELVLHRGHYRYVVLLAFPIGGPSDPWGRGPLGGLTLDSAGNVYGTTYQGAQCEAGTAFEANTTAVVHIFGCMNADGANPAASMISDSNGTLYGTTQYGGSSRNCGCGVVFRLTGSGPSRTETILHTFAGAPNDGGHPVASLFRGPKGALYGTTPLGGAYKNGTVYVLSPVGSKYQESVLYNFSGPDGSTPVANVIMVKDNIYGTTEFGGAYGYGTVFELYVSQGHYVERVLYSFKAGTDGAYPLGGLVYQNGALFGTTEKGGLWSSGTAFELRP
ncbi:MAG: hypothetical protein JO060_05515 [Candidatus Eremiobacteraeota bacterium]|nr:hypothetical protein [Candidatus Eremiobacteraeota bacterium]MBV9647788.1 hypothetical protein [Candidatus Eremiobacteraeota bacterium]